MRRWAVYATVFLLGGLTAVGLNTSLTKKTAISARVARVIDGDTIELVDGRKVRYIGIDSPEMGDSRKATACFAAEAAEENRKLVEGKTVRLVSDVSETDHYGRLLRYVYTSDVFVNDSLVRQGFANVATFPPDVAYQEQFLESQREAREQGRGLWDKCP